MKRIPWRQLRAPDPEHRYVVSAGVFVLDRGRSIPAFLRHSLRVRRLVRRTPGAVGYALVADSRRRAFTEISAFESPKAMRAFVAQPIHQAAIKAMLPHIAPGSKLVGIELYGRDLPPRPEVVTAKLEASPGIEEVGQLQGHGVDGPRSGHPARAHEGSPGLDHTPAD